MSVDLYIQAFENREPQRIPTADILRCFQKFITQRGDSYIDLAFGPHDTSTICFSVNEDTDIGVMVNRPCGDPRLAKCLYALMKLGNCVLFVPGEEGFIVLNQESINHMPEDMKENLGEAKLADNEEAFNEFYENPL